MTAAKVRADYEQLKQIASAFQRNVEASQRTLETIRHNKEILEGGDWVGQGATAFYREMDDSVLPALQRLINALDSAANSASEISAIMKDAEDQAANVLKGPGNGDGAASSMGAVASASTLGSVNSGTASAFVAARPRAGGTRSKPGHAGSPNVAGPQRDNYRSEHILKDLEAANPALAAQVKQDPNLTRDLQRLAAGHWNVQTGQAGEKVDVDYGDQTITVGPDASLASLTKAVQQVRDNPAILENSGLSSKVIQQIKNDPVLMAQVRLLGEDQYSQWKIQMGTQNGVSMTRFGSDEIVLNPKNPVGSLRSSLNTAFRGADEESMPLNQATSREHYVDFNSDSRLYNDANQMLMTYEAQHEATGTMPTTLPNGHRTTNPAAYQQAVTDYWSGKISYATARGQLHDLMTQEPAGVSDQHKYAAEYLKKWDAQHAPSK